MTHDRPTLPLAPIDAYTTLLARARESEPYHRFCQQHLGCAVGQLSPLTAHELDTLVQVCPSGPGVSVLDLGAGNGGVAATLARRCQAQVTAVDWATTSAGNALPHNHGAGSVRFEVADLRTFERPRGALDAILLVDVLALLEKAPRHLTRWASWLSPGGRLVVLGHSRNHGNSRRQPSNPHPRLSGIARRLLELGLRVTEVDLDRFEPRLWQRQLELLQSMAPEFEASGDQFLLEVLRREAEQAATWATAERSHRRLTVGARPNA